MMKVSAFALLSLALTEARLGGDEYSGAVRKLQDEPELEIVGNDGDFEVFPLGPCQGECDSDADCAEGLYCFQREAGDSVPGCQDAGQGFESRGDYCVYKEMSGDMDMDMNMTMVPTMDMTMSDTDMLAGAVMAAEESLSPCPVGEGICTLEYMPVMCGTCEYGNACGAELAGFDPAVDCTPVFTEGPTPPPGTLTMAGQNGEPADVFPLGVCEGDCDNDDECGEGLVCLQRGIGDEVPGCTGGLQSETDFCVLAIYVWTPEEMFNAATTTPEEEDGEEEEDDEDEEEEMAMPEETMIPTEPAEEMMEEETELVEEDQVEMPEVEDVEVTTVAPTMGETMGETMMMTMDETEMETLAETIGETLQEVNIEK